ncbi:hypothetical protein KIPB_010398 [Kipferlia bialata]|uniref:EF-hand domain-containing protein n=1 Tax=Kipferlia bialata TaxID=797122 RepID=A0A9K3D3N9_9EUKA|nr:hypothetical protein KIPB_010398 [Kipferlia bialata]|eukprot:g10398.t1
MGTDIRSIFSSLELELYTAVFNRFKQDNVVTGHSVKDFFRGANIEAKLLFQVWNKADSNHNGVLEYTEFLVAMRLIAACQNRLGIPTCYKPGFPALATFRDTQYTEIRHRLEHPPKAKPDAKDELMVRIA